MQNQRPIALVTGSSRGIGKAVALELARSGHSLIINYFDEERDANQVCTEIKALGAVALPVRADVANREAVQKMLSTIATEFGRLDVLVNNAGITRDRSLAKMSYEEWDEVLKVNLSAPFSLLKEALPLLTKSAGASVVNISSIVAATGAFGQTNYAAAKAGLLGLTRTAAIELARYKIRVNAIAPGYIDTEMLQAVPEQVRSEIQKKILLARFGSPTEIAATVRFLVTEGTYITGQCLHVNGGLFLG